jgi:hypothetical protein
MSLAQHHQMMKIGCGPWAIFKIDAHAAGAAPSEDENGPPALGAIFKIANVVFCTTKTGG